MSVFVERRKPSIIIDKIMTYWIGVFGTMRAITESDERIRRALRHKMVMKYITSEKDVRDGWDCRDEYGVD